MMIIELIMYALVVSFVALVILGHVLLASAIVQCAREDFTGGRRRTNAEREPATGVGRFKALVAHYARFGAALPERGARRAG